MHKEKEMAEYNTRGQKHGQFGKDYDCKYNKAVAWNKIFDTLIDDRFTYNTGIKYSDHVGEYDKEGNRTFDLKEISLRDLIAGDVVEIETEYTTMGNDYVEMIRKAVIRLPKRKDGEQVVAVVLFGDSGNTFVKTAWLNKSDDNHQTGLDTTDIDRHIEGKFGVYVRNALKEIYTIDKNGNATKVEKPRNDNKKRRR